MPMPTQSGSCAQSVKSVSIGPCLSGRDVCATSSTSLRRTTTRERNHQGLGNELIAPGCGQNGGTRVCCRERLGGLLRSYHRAA